jgi:uncharacterized protein (DUF58 family)
VAGEAGDAIPLLPKRRLIGTATGGSSSIRRGGRADVATSRPYRPGDHFRTIDWKSSARLSSTRQTDEFIVRERYTDEMPVVVLVVDRRPEMSLYPAELPWLHKPSAVRASVELVVRSARNHRSLVGYLDLATHRGDPHGEGPFWRAPRARASGARAGRREPLEAWLSEDFDAPQDNLEHGLRFLLHQRGSVPIGSFVFVVSDFVVRPPLDAWAYAIDRGWDVVPVIVQDPVWEQSFPQVDGVLVPFADARGRRPRYARLDAHEVRDRRRAHEERLASLRTTFLRLGLDSVLVGDAEPAVVHASFLEWARARLALRWERR